MLKFHHIIRPTISDSFFEQSVGLWLGTCAGHMGPQMYQHHSGKRGEQSMSGVLTWENHAKQGTLPLESRNSFRNHIYEIADEVEETIPVVEFGPGSMEDAKVLVESFGCDRYIPVDCSLGIISQAEPFAKTTACTVSPSVIDFFSDENCPLVDDSAVGVLLGLTIDNIPGPVPSVEPRDQLTKALHNLVKAMPFGGYLLVSTDTCQDGARNRELYNEPWHKLFGVNHIYRMAEELPMKNFDPDGFEYLPVWHPHCSLLAHTVVATKDQDFLMGEQNEIAISVRKGDVFHYNNSFKYHPNLFEDCAEDAGLDIIDSWSDASTIRLYLFHVSPRDARNTYCAPTYTKKAVGTSSNRLALAQRVLHKQ